MLIQGIFLFIAVAGAAALCLALPALSFWWLLPLVVGLYAAVVILFILGALLLSYGAPHIQKPATRRRYFRFLAHAATPISTADWQAVINAEALTCSPKTLKNAWGFLKAALSEHGISPAVTLPAQRKTEKAWLTPEQIQTFLVAAHDAPGELGALLALSSLRRSEIYGLTWDDVDLKRGVIHVHQSRVMDENNQLVIRSQNKTAASTRDVPIFLPRLRELLCQPHEPGPVITAAIGTLYDQINTICARARLPAVGVHGLRHSFASLCYSIGLNELQCMRIGGWSDYGTMRKVYTHLSQRDADTGAEKLQQWFENAHENAHAANEPA